MTRTRGSLVHWCTLPAGHEGVHRPLSLYDVDLVDWYHDHAGSYPPAVVGGWLQQARCHDWDIGYHYDRTRPKLKASGRRKEMERGRVQDVRGDQPGRSETGDREEDADLAPRPVQQAFWP